MLYHTVQRGDSLWQIAKEHRISLDALLAANPQITDPNYIMPGSQINIPSLIPIEEEDFENNGANMPGLEDCQCSKAGARPCIYITRGGETLYNISTDWQIPPAQLHYHNYQYPQNMQLPAGERIVIPATSNYYMQPQPRKRRK